MVDLRGRTIQLVGDENAEALRGINEQLSAFNEQLQHLNQTMDVIANALTGGSPPPSMNGHAPEPDLGV